MRRAYLDNLRWVIMLELILMHTCMCFNSSHLPYYYTAPGYLGLDTVLVLSEPWRQGAFFLAAGASMRYALQKQGTGRFVLSRLVRIGLPFAFAKVTLIPGQVYLGFYATGGFSGGFFAFLREIYFPGFWSFYGSQDAQLWFLRVLLVDTAALLVLLVLVNRRDWLWRLCERVNLQTLVLLTLPAALCGFLLRRGVYHYYGRYFFLLAAGYLLFSHDRVCCLAGRYWAGLSAMTGVLLGYLLVKLLGTNYYAIRSPLDEGLWYAAGWLGSLACLGLFRRFGARSGPVCRYFSGASYCIYLVHQTILVWLAYAIVPLGWPRWGNYLAVCLGTGVLSLAVYEAVRRVPVLRTALGA